MAVDRLTVKTSFSLGPSRDDDVPFAGGGDDGGDDDGLNCWVSGKRPASRVVPSSIPTQSCQPDSFPLTSQTEPDQSKDSPSSTRVVGIHLSRCWRIYRQGFPRSLGECYFLHLVFNQGNIPILSHQRLWLWAIRGLPRPLNDWLVSAPCIPPMALLQANKSPNWWL